MIIYISSCFFFFFFFFLLIHTFTSPTRNLLEKSLFHTMHQLTLSNRETEQLKGFFFLPSDLITVFLGLKDRKILKDGYINYPIRNGTFSSVHLFVISRYTNVYWSTKLLLPQYLNALSTHFLPVSHAHI